MKRTPFLLILLLLNYAGSVAQGSQKTDEYPDVVLEVTYAKGSPLAFQQIEQWSVYGGFRFLPNGLVQRNLAVLQVGSGEFVTIDKPAEKFLKY